MAKKVPLNPETMTPQQVVDQLAKYLSEGGASFGAGPSRVWEDWLAYCTVVLETGLGPFREGRLPEDLTPIDAEMERLRQRYDAPHGNFDRLIGNFRQAVLLWYGFSAANLYDVLGDTYMQHMLPNKDGGQVFTPWHVALMMAQMTITNGAQLVFERIRDAIDRLRAVDEAAALYCDAVIMTAAVAIEIEGSVNPLQSLLLPILPLIKDHYEPISICDPACGSGNLLIAASSAFPHFAVRLGLVQFYGNDIAYVCVQMAHLYEMAYGLNGYGAAAVWADLVTEGAEGVAVEVVTTVEGDDTEQAAADGDAPIVVTTVPAEAPPAALIPLALPAPEIREDSAPLAPVLTPRRKAIRAQTEEAPAQQMTFTFLHETQGAER